MELFQRGCAERAGGNSIRSGVLDRTSSAAFESDGNAPFRLESSLSRPPRCAPAVSLQLPDRGDCGRDTVASARTTGSAGEVRSAAESGRANSSPATGGQNGSAGGRGAQRTAEFTGAATENFGVAGEKL